MSEISNFRNTPNIFSVSQFHKKKEEYTSLKHLKIQPTKTQTF